MNTQVQKKSRVCNFRLTNINPSLCELRDFVLQTLIRKDQQFYLFYGPVLDNLRSFQRLDLTLRSSQLPTLVCSTASETRHQ